MKPGQKNAAQIFALAITKLRYILKSVFTIPVASTIVVRDRETGRIMSISDDGDSASYERLFGHLEKELGASTTAVYANVNIATGKIENWKEKENEH